MNPGPGNLRPGADAGQDEADTARRLREQIAAQFGRSLHIRTLDTGSCAVCEQEIRLLSAPHYDLHRLGASSSLLRPGTRTCCWSPGRWCAPSR